MLRLARLQLGQDGDEAATECGRGLREEGEELFIGACSSASSERAENRAQLPATRLRKLKAKLEARGLEQGSQTGSTKVNKGASRQRSRHKKF